MRSPFRHTSMPDLQNEMAITGRLIEGLKRDKRMANTPDGKQAIQEKLDTLREHAQAVSNEILSRKSVFGN